MRRIKSKLEPTLEEAFSIGRNEGLKEGFKEILEMVQLGDLKHVEMYLRARLKTIQDKHTNPFKQKE